MCWTNVALQVRIQPDAYTVGPQTIGSRVEIDPKFPNSRLEWATKRRGVTVLVGLLVRMEGPGLDGGAETVLRAGFRHLEPAIAQSVFKT